MLHVWKRYVKTEYYVFVDESFRRFLNMTDVDSRFGYFSYGGVGVPLIEYDSLKISLAPIVVDYLKLVPQDETELKHTHLKRVPYHERMAIVERISRALVKHGAFVSGFYRPAQSLVMESVRDAIMEEHDSLPEDTIDLY